MLQLVWKEGLEKTVQKVENIKQQKTTGLTTPKPVKIGTKTFNSGEMHRLALLPWNSLLFLERFSIMNIKNAAMFYQNIPKMPKKKKKKKKVVAIKISARTTTSQQFRIPLWNVGSTGAFLATTTVRAVPLYFKSGLEELNCWPLHDHQKIYHPKQPLAAASVITAEIIISIISSINNTNLLSATLSPPTSSTPPSLTQQH